MRKIIFETVQYITALFGTCDPETLCDALSISLASADMPSDTNGFYFSLSGKKAIVINSALSGERRKYCIAHELGHALLHEELNTAFLHQSTHFITGRYEREANLFAAYLLLGKPNRKMLFGKTVAEISQNTFLPADSVKEWANFAA